MNYVAVGIITKSFGDIAWYLDQLFNTKIIESGQLVERPVTRTSPRLEPIVPN